MILLKKIKYGFCIVNASLIFAENWKGCLVMTDIIYYKDQIQPCQIYISSHYAEST